MRKLNTGDKVRITGNYSQGLRHFFKIGSMGYVQVIRTGVLLKGEVKSVEAYTIYIKDTNERYIVAVEDLEKISQ